MKKIFFSLFILILFAIIVWGSSRGGNPIASRLSVERSDGFTNETIISGSNNVKLFGFALKNGTSTNSTSTDFLIKSSTFVKGAASSTTTFPANMVRNMRLMINGTQAGFAPSLAAGTFNTNFIIPVVSIMQIDIFADIATTTATSTLQINLIDMQARDTQAGIPENVVRASDGEILSPITPLTSGSFTITP